MRYPVDGSEPYTVERSRFEPPNIEPNTAEILALFLAQYWSYLAPAERNWILARVMSLLGHYFQPEHPAIVYEGLAEDWVADLCEYPRWAIDEAVQRWRRSEPRRRPAPGDIRKDCERLVGDHRRLARKLQITLEHHACSQA